jgi:formate dehydrogenase maturation protein FdhE
MHPLAGDMTQFKDSELEEKISSLTNKYFMTYNVDVRQQMSMLLETYKSELSKRRAEALEKLMQKSEKNLDKLVRVS